MSSPETPAHRNLKRLAFAWAQANGLPLCAEEVALPRCPYRADLAAASLRVSSAEGILAVFECKQSRADWLRDSAREGETRRRAREVAERLRALRDLVAVHRPDLRRGESLFAEFDAYDYAGLRHDTLHGLETELATLQRKLAGSVKFDRLARYRTCSLRYLVTEAGIAEEHEIPVGWGWLERAGERLQLRGKPVRTDCDAATRIAALERIARAGTRLLGAAYRAASTGTSGEPGEPAAKAERSSNAPAPAS